MSIGMSDILEGMGAVSLVVLTSIPILFIVCLIYSVHDMVIDYKKFRKEVSESLKDLRKRVSTQEEKNNMKGKGK